MSPRHQLIALVTLAAIIIAAAWVILFRNHALTPQTNGRAAPTLSDISKQFDRSVEQLRAITVQQANVPAPGGSALSGNASAPPRTTSDDRRTAPAP